MKKVNSNLVLAVVMAVLSGGGLTFGFAGGDGSEGNPWQISTKTDLEAVNNDLSAHYILVNDIDLTGTSPYAKAVIEININKVVKKCIFNFSSFIIIFLFFNFQ